MLKVQSNATRSNLRVKKLATKKPVNLGDTIGYVAPAVIESDLHAFTFKEVEPDIDEQYFLKDRTIADSVNAMRKILKSYWPFDVCFPFRCAMFGLADQFHETHEYAYSIGMPPSNPTVFIPVFIPQTDEHRACNGIAIWFASNRKAFNSIGNSVVFRNWIGNGYECYIVTDLHTAIQICLKHLKDWAKSCNHPVLIEMRNRPELVYGLYETMPTDNGLEPTKLNDLGVFTYQPKMNASDKETHKAKQLETHVSLPKEPKTYGRLGKFFELGN